LHFFVFVVCNLLSESEIRDDWPRSVEERWLGRKTE